MSNLGKQLKMRMRNNTGLLAFSWLGEKIEINSMWASVVSGKHHLQLVLEGAGDS